LSSWLFFTLTGVVVFCSLIALGVYAYGRFIHRDTGSPSHAFALSDQTVLDRLIETLVQAHGNTCGIVLISDGRDALAARLLSARSAERSLDLQYYYWKDDVTGTLLAGEVLAAADRGVRVRLQLDDINLRGKDATYLSLDAHPNIEVRAFNPCWNRVGAFQRGLEVLFRAYSSTRRMHNKAWITDGRIAIVGGRNVGDAYFDVSSQLNFQDLDVAIVGLAVQSAERVFDQFWNSNCVIPLASLPGLQTGDLADLGERLSAARKSDQADFLHEGMEHLKSIEHFINSSTIHWTDNVRIVSDPPAKLEAQKKNKWLYREIIPLILSATESLRITSPYFVPGRKGVEQLTGLVKRGVDVSILTNSLAATDVAAVHGGYSRYRKSLLRGGVRLHELKAEPHQQRISAFGSSGASLHTKSFVIDGRVGFVGSFNFDPRSVSLNTEMGVLFDEPALAEELTELFRLQTSLKTSYRLEFARGRLTWFDGTIAKTEPGASLIRRIISKIVRYLPLESQL
jgi:putative cardiolipin synthase